MKRTRYLPHTAALLLLALPACRFLSLPTPASAPASAAQEEPEFIRFSRLGLGNAPPPAPLPPQESAPPSTPEPLPEAPPAPLPPDPKTAEDGRQDPASGASVQIARSTDMTSGSSVPAESTPPSAGAGTGFRWALESWGGKAGITAGEDGTIAIAIQDPGSSGKIAFFSKTPAVFHSTPPGAVILTAEYEGAAEISLACYLRLGPGQTYYESAAEILHAGRNPLRFTLSQPTWKNEATRWQHEIAVPADAQLNDIGFVLYTGRGGNHLILRELRLETSAGR